MTDTGQIPGEGLPGNAGVVEQQPGVPAPDAYTLVDPSGRPAAGPAEPVRPAVHPAGDDLLLMPGAQGAWSDPQGTLGGQYPSPVQPLGAAPVAQAAPVAAPASVPAAVEATPPQGVPVVQPAAPAAPVDPGQMYEAVPAPAPHPAVPVAAAGAPAQSPPAAGPEFTGPGFAAPTDLGSPEQPGAAESVVMPPAGTVAAPAQTAPTDLGSPESADSAQAPQAAPVIQPGGQTPAAGVPVDAGSAAQAPAPEVPDQVRVPVQAGAQEDQQPSAVADVPVAADGPAVPDSAEQPVPVAAFAAGSATPTPPSARRPLHMGPPLPDNTGGVVRSLADRGPAGVAPHPLTVQPDSGPPTLGPEYLDVPGEDEAPVLPGPQLAEIPPQAGAPWDAVPQQGEATPAPAAETVVPQPAPEEPAAPPAAEMPPAVETAGADEASEQPVAPEQAVVPDAADAPEVPAQAAAPEQVEGTADAVTPEQAAAPEAVVAPEQPVAPEAVVVPEGDATSEQPMAPEQAAASGEALAPDAAGATGDPAQVATPEPTEPTEPTELPKTDEAAAPVAGAEPPAEGAVTVEPVAGEEQTPGPVEAPGSAPVPPQAAPEPVPAGTAVPQQAETPAPEAQAPQAQAPEAQPAAPEQAADAPATAPEPVPAGEAGTAPDPEPTPQEAPAAEAAPTPADATPEPPADSAPEAPEAVAASGAEAGAEAPAAPAPASEPVPGAEVPAEAPAEPAGPPAPAYDDAEREAVLKVMRERRDIRNGFRSDPIPHDVLLRVLEAAHTAPSVGHSQPWDFVVIRSAETRTTMHELAQRQRHAYAKSLPKGRAKQFKELKIEAILDTPVNIVVTADPTRGGRHTLGRHTQPQMAPYSSALAVENLWLAARAEGLGVGWVSFFDEREMVRTLGLPEHLEVVAYLCVGYVDEFPEEPELAQAGWSKRRPLSWVVHEETYGRRALPGEEPHDLLQETVAAIRPLDAKALGEAWERQKRMTKPAGALGMLEIISAQLSGLSRVCPPPIPEPAAVAIFAGDHGVHAQGVTAWPQEVTGQMVANFLGGGAVCNAFANQVGAEVCVIDVGVATELPAQPGLVPRKVRPGTADFTTGPALTREEVLAAVEVGVETARDLVAAGNKALLTGEMGIANTTVSAALISVYTDTDPAEITGRGTGINDEMHARKVDVVRRGLELHAPDPEDPIGVLAAIGGLEHAALVGLILGGASLRVPVVLDGVSAGAAALVARAIAPEALAACIAGHRGAEPGHVAALNKLGLRPLIDLDLRLGEGTGALLALPVVQSAARAMHEVATFDSAGVTEK
ncbi:nicotinate-nucleotide--dimethylbenzimidazole phosphoribosyltransferase [Streptomyces tsukubensis]|uniref:nicotinate-nucleotide--dimethylbenzimidazole phosphoribosyltransferase n=1 Tax=Streptomyces tsukubensis TaxID=83656 RepID=UPI00368874F8